MIQCRTQRPHHHFLIISSTVFSTVFLLNHFLAGTVTAFIYSWMIDPQLNACTRTVTDILPWMEINYESRKKLKHGWRLQKLLTPANNHTLMCLTPRKQRPGTIWKDRFPCASLRFWNALMSTQAAWLTATNLNSGNKTVFKEVWQNDSNKVPNSANSDLLLRKPNMIQTICNLLLIMAGISFNGVMILVNIF